MRILFVHEKIGAFGGAEANVLLTATAFAERGHAVGLVHGAGTGKGEDEWAAVFADCFSFSPGAAPRARDAGASVIGRALAHFRPDVVFLHKMADAGVLRALAGGEVPVARMVHDHDLYCMRGYKYNPISRAICTRPASLYCVFPCAASVCRGAGGGLSLRWASYRDKLREIEVNRAFRRLIVATGYMRDELLRNGFPPGRIAIHAPVPRAAAAADTASFGARNLIVYAGQIVRGKGVDVLLESLARVTAPFECVIIGDGSHRAACERLRDRLGLGGKARFAGFLPQARIAEHYREASLSVMSSLWPEPFGATGLEAMRHGLPVVAFDAGGIREWLIDGQNGFLAPWMDRERYAARIDALLHDKALARRMGERGREMADKHFNFDGYIDGLGDLLARTAGLVPENAR